MRLLRKIWNRIRRTPAAAPHACVDAEPYNPVMLTHRFMQPPPRPCDHPLDEGLHVTDEGLVIETPARGDALTFTVTVWCSWCAQPKAGHPDGGLLPEIDAKRPAAHRRLHDVVRATARGFDADLAQQAEEAIEKELTAAFLAPIHDCDDVTVRCSVRAWVTLGEEVLEYQRGVGRDLLESRARLALTRAHVERLSGERDLWLGFLEESAKNWRSRFAVQLAEHPVNMAATMGVMESERREEADRFLSLVHNVVRAQQAVNVFDLVTDSESALRVALEQLGVRLPEPSSDLPWERV
ncbi:hypothetical protein GCM10017673_26000 [Streptosporangium violaceochromogenes]|nr:hypothetical protein GCM10017673_26000 [Streptosporangium violaceochromogenes]